MSESKKLWGGRFEGAIDPGFGFEANRRYLRRGNHNLRAGKYGVGIIPPNPADVLAADMRRHLGRAVGPPDERGHVRILLQEPLVPAWQRVHDGLAAAGDDWEQHLQLNPLPA